jgi:hypothetical protein
MVPKNSSGIVEGLPRALISIQRNMKKEIYDGFEENVLSDIWKQTRLEPRAIEFQSEIVRKGKKALKITIHKGDKSEIGDPNTNKTERDELLERTNLWANEGIGYRYSFSIYLPKDFPIVPTRLVLAQWKQDEEENKVSVNNPILALRYVNAELFITLQIGDCNERIKLFRTSEDVLGKWLDFIFEVNFTTKNFGFVKVWLNNKQLVDYKGITAYSKKYGYPKDGKFFFKMGLYRDTMDKPMTAYFDEFRKTLLS